MKPPASIAASRSSASILDGKIEELGTVRPNRGGLRTSCGSGTSRPLDLILSTALEVYLDNWKNARGEAAGVVYGRTRKPRLCCRPWWTELPELEATAPWVHKKLELTRLNLPNLRFVDVLNWSGDYVNSPMTIVAQSLPNDDWVIANVGSVNLVYRNTGKAIH